MSRIIRQMSISSRSAVAYLVASASGFAAPYLLVITSAYVSNLIDPMARIRSFLLMIPPHHPVRLAAAAMALHVGIGAVIGAAVSLLATLTHDRRYWLIWLFFSSGFLTSLLISAPSFHSWLWTPLTRLAAFAGAAAVAAFGLRVWTLRGEGFR
jgi:hypothetical protein